MFVDKACCKMWKSSGQAMQPSELPSSRLTCAVQPQGPKGVLSSGSANPNKAQAEPERGMSALLVVDGKSQPNAGFNCTTAASVDSKLSFVIDVELTTGNRG
ncbi:hypothetical protein EYF80_006020 [Liparis tanakae]|uniref:Uncharacterized protein n=1 Tax=Liparis tanakae TaxID=230148 RepID=A0A4Z2J1Y4_9TELE|nr:hypothetical protein EYF80_006020 [Liparis tanakae]